MTNRHPLFSSFYFLLFSVHPHSCRCKWLCPLHRWVLVQYMGKDLCFHAASLATTSWSTWPPHNLTNPENQSSVHIPTEGQPNTKRWCWIGRRTPKGFSSWIYHLRPLHVTEYQCQWTLARLSPMKEARHQRPCIIGLWLWDRPIKGKSNRLESTLEAVSLQGKQEWQKMGVENGGWVWNLLLRRWKCSRTRWWGCLQFLGMYNASEFCIPDINYEWYVRFIETIKRVETRESFTVYVTFSIFKIETDTEPSSKIIQCFPIPHNCVTCPTH